MYSASGVRGALERGKEREVPWSFFRMGKGGRKSKLSQSASSGKSEPREANRKIGVDGWTAMRWPLDISA